MISLTRRIAPALCWTVLGFAGSQADAGLVPWMYNAVFGYGPVFGGYHAAYPAYAGWGGYGYGSGLGYPAAPVYAPGYVAPSVSPCGPGGCPPTSVNYAPDVCCNPCPPCSACETGVNYSAPPEGNSPAEPTPSPSPPPADDFKGTTTRNRDAQPAPEESNAPRYEPPIPSPAPGEPSGGEAPPADGSEVDAEAGEVDLEPLKIEVPVSSTLQPVRRRTGLSIGYRVPTVVRVAISPSSPNPTRSPQLAGK